MPIGDGGGVLFLLARAYTGVVIGVDAVPAEVEADVANGLPNFEIVGLPDASVRESKERVRSAIRNTGFELPVRRVTINLAPAHLRKVGPAFDLPIALAVLGASGQLAAGALASHLFAGELSLDGRLKPVRGALALATAAVHFDLHGMVLPEESAREAGACPCVSSLPAASLRDVVERLRGDRRWVPISEPAGTGPSSGGESPAPDLADIHGHSVPKRALEIAAAGGHHIALIGPPGAGKTLLARALAGILPPMTTEESVEVNRIRGVAGLATDVTRRAARPFRAPHHTTTRFGLIGGGARVTPGEATFAHRGVLLLDEYPEFRRDVLDALRQPMEDGVVRAVRAGRPVVLPARFTLVLTANPCPCGYYGDPDVPCQCSSGQVLRYRRRFTGPIWDRMDLQLVVARQPQADWAAHASECSETVRARVLSARKRQARRLEASTSRTNGEMGPREIDGTVSLNAEAREVLVGAAARLHLSGRGRHRVMRVARTIADLRGGDRVETPDIAEAVQNRVAE